MCPSCNRAVDQCICSRGSSRPKGDGNVRVGRETKGRRGKGVTVITGLPLGDDELKQLARELKGLCGSGGTVKDGVVEIQGEHRDKLVKVLGERGYSVKRAGG